MVIDGRLYNNKNELRKILLKVYIYIREKSRNKRG